MIRAVLLATHVRLNTLVQGVGTTSKAAQVRTTTGASGTRSAACTRDRNAVRCPRTRRRSLEAADTRSRRHPRHRRVRPDRPMLSRCNGTGCSRPSTDTPVASRTPDTACIQRPGPMQHGRPPQHRRFRPRRPQHPSAVRPPWRRGGRDPLESCSRHIRRKRSKRRAMRAVSRIVMAAASHVRLQPGAYRTRRRRASEPSWMATRSRARSAAKFKPDATFVPIRRCAPLAEGLDSRHG